MMCRHIICIPYVILIYCLLCHPSYHADVTLGHREGMDLVEDGGCLKDGIVSLEHGKLSAFLST